MREGHKRVEVTKRTHKASGISLVGAHFVVDFD
jgi:hypothetical protein